MPNLSLREIIENWEKIKKNIRDTSRKRKFQLEESWDKTIFFKTT